jgi:hypothetical protein
LRQRTPPPLRARFPASAREARGGGRRRRRRRRKRKREEKEKRGVSKRRGASPYKFSRLSTN